MAFHSLSEALQPGWEAAQFCLLPLFMVGLVFIGPALCKIVARVHCSRRPSSIKAAGLLTAGAAVASGNWVFYRCTGWAFPGYVWLPDVLFILAMIGWLRTPMVHLRAGTAERLDNKIARLRVEGWNALICRWIPSTGVHRVLLTKGTERAALGPVRAARHLTRAGILE